MSLKSIQKPTGQLQILIYLYNNEKAHDKFLRHRIGINPVTAASALSNLEDLKLVRKYSNGNYRLTKKGKQVAEHLDKVEELLPNL